MRFLVLGGTTFLSREIARSALEHDHDVVCLARGDAGAFAPGTLPVLADRRWGPVVYEALEGTFDAGIDVANEPAFVSEAVAALGHRARHWTYVSSISVYADHSVPWADETAEVVVPATATSEEPADYAATKSANEKFCQDFLGDRLNVARPGLIVGPGDVSDRFGYWPARLSRNSSSPVVVPDSPDCAVQVIDVSDLANWIVECSERELVGTFNVTGPSLALSDVLDVVADVCDFRGEMVPLGEPMLLEQGVAPWSGPESLPLWLPSDGSYDGFARRDVSGALDHGLNLRRLSESVKATLDDEIERGIDRPRQAGLTPEKERALIAGIS